MLLAFSIGVKSSKLNAWLQCTLPSAYTISKRAPRQRSMSIREMYKLERVRRSNAKTVIQCNRQPVLTIVNDDGEYERPTTTIYRGHEGGQIVALLQGSNVILYNNKLPTPVAHILDVVKCDQKFGR